MLFSQLKLNPDHQYLKMADQIGPEFKDAIVKDFQRMHQQLIETMEQDQEIDPELLPEYESAIHNYFLYFLYGCSTILDSTSETNTAWQKREMEKATEAIKNLGKIFNPNGGKDDNSKA